MIVDIAEFLPPTRGELRCTGIGRDADHAASLVLYFDRKPTDYEMRFLHDVMKRACALMPKHSAGQEGGSAR